MTQPSTLLPGNLIADCFVCGASDQFICRSRSSDGKFKVVKRGFPTCLENERLCDACEAKFVRSDLKRIKQ